MEYDARQALNLGAELLPSTVAERAYVWFPGFCAYRDHSKRQQDSAGETAHVGQKMESGVDA